MKNWTHCSPPPSRENKIGRTSEKKRALDSNPGMPLIGARDMHVQKHVSKNRSRFCKRTKRKRRQLKTTALYPAEPPAVPFSI